MASISNIIEGSNGNNEPEEVATTSGAIAADSTLAGEAVMSPSTTPVVTLALNTTPESLENRGTTSVVSTALQHLRDVFRVNLRKSLVSGRLLQVQRFTGRTELVQSSLLKLVELEAARGELENQVF